jgi:hypothetical protein
MHDGNIIFAHSQGREVEAERQSALPVRNERAQGEGETDLMQSSKGDPGSRFY